MESAGMPSGQRRNAADTASRFDCQWRRLVFAETVRERHVIIMGLLIKSSSPMTTHCVAVADRSGCRIWYGPMGKIPVQVKADLLTNQM
jgi:hypothetical protein